ncbi:MAG: GPW/gp25 family protein [Lachnospiraceae bacterium]|nr:GPW/gp25 family protein [Lachnospiraceae bacterium]
MADKAFLGMGMKFPPQINPATGRFVVSTNEESVKESIYLILMTQKSERFLRPEFGSDLLSYTFMDINLTSVSILKRNITDQLLSQEPRIGDITIETDSTTKPGCLILNIGYTIIESNTRDNLVFPFYMDQIEEDNKDEQQNQWEEYNSYEPEDESAGLLEG